MKLYRGIRAKEFIHFTPEAVHHLRSTWRKLLKNRASGDFSYPDNLNEEILIAAQLVRLQRQHFTDQKDIAFDYAKANDGLLVEIDAPISDVVEHFNIEFQKFAQRRDKFELVYAVNAEILCSNIKKWKMKVSAAG